MTSGRDERAVATATITVMFTDIVGSTALIDALGDVAAERARRTHFALLRTQLTAANGREVKNTGDGLMAVFASTRDAVRGAVAIQQAVERHQRLARPALEVRVGVHVGEAIADEGDYFGATVNIARRLCDSAAPGQILVSEVVRALLGHGSGPDLRPIGALALKGFAQPVEACEVAWTDTTSGTRSVPPALDEPDRLPFVGRRDEMKVFDECWADLSRGTRFVGVHGEAGIGKSRLAKEFARRAGDRGAIILFGRCDEDPLLPYQPFVEALREAFAGGAVAALDGLPPGTVANLARLVPELGVVGPAGSTDPGLDRYLLFEAVRVTLARLAEDGPVVFVVEDLHWADQPTLMLLRHLLSVAGSAPILFLGTYRDVATERSPGVADAVAEWQGLEATTTLALAGLDRADVFELVAAAGVSHVDDATSLDHDDALAGRLHRRSEGNPLFVRELLRDALESGDPEALADGGVSETLRAVIARRLSRLSAATLHVLEVAAVAGAVFDVEVLRRAAEGDVDISILSALDEAIAAREVVEAPGRAGAFAFAHDLVRQAIYSGVPAGRKADLHRRVGQAIDALWGDDDDWLSSLAHHFCAAVPAGVAEEAVTFASRAGERALQAFAYEEAVLQFDRALDAARSLDRDPQRSARLLLGRARALMYTGDVPAAREGFRQAVALARRGDAPTLLAQAALGLGQGGPGVSHLDQELVSALDEARVALGPDDRGLRAQVGARLARERFGGGDRSGADRLSAAAIDDARAADDPIALAVALNARRQCLEGLANLRRRLEIDEEILSLAGRAGDPELALTAWASKVVDHLRLGDIPAVDDDLRVFERLLGEVRHGPRVAWYLATYRAMRALFAGRLDEAETLADEAVGLGQKAASVDAPLNHAAQLLSIRREQGRLDELAPVVDAFAAEAGGLLAWTLLQALVCVESGDLEAARRVIGRVPPSAFVALPQDDFWLMTLALAAEAVAAVGDHDRARVLFELLEPAAGYNVVVGGAVVALGATDQFLGLLAACLGRVEESDRYFSEACRRNDEMGAVAPGIRTRINWSASRRRSGDLDGALAPAREALALAEAAGHTAAAATARRLAALA